MEMSHSIHSGIMKIYKTLNGVDVTLYSSPGFSLCAFCPLTLLTEPLE